MIIGATSVPNSSAPTASARVRATPPNPPTLRPRVAPHRSAASPHPACRVTPSAVAEPPLVVATLRGHQVLRLQGEWLGTYFASSNKYCQLNPGIQSVHSQQRIGGHRVFADLEAQCRAFITESRAE